MTVGVYPDLVLGAAPPDRPYVFINMVATIDGKTISGTRNESVTDLGSDVDHLSMRQIESFADAVLIGAGSLRATKNLHYGKSIKRIVVTKSGDLPYESKFFSEAPNDAMIAAASENVKKIRSDQKTIVAGEAEIDWFKLLRILRHDHGVKQLLVEGGSEINAALLAEDLVDELFLTVAPFIKLGSSTPTYAGGTPLDRKNLKRFSLSSSIVVADEIFLRYKRHR